MSDPTPAPVPSELRMQDVILGRFRAGDSVEALALDYGLDEMGVLRAIVAAARREMGPMKGQGGKP